MRIMFETGCDNNDGSDFTFGQTETAIDANMQATTF